MRIIGGSAGGRILKVPPGLDVRPTPDLVKQAIFNSLGDRVVGARVLELFAGTGALSLECLSRGSHSALCIESSRRHAQFIHQNQRLAGLEATLMDVRVVDAFQAIEDLVPIDPPFGLVLADPPYGEKNVGRRSESFAQRLLDHPKLARLLDPYGLLVLGHTKRDTLEIPACWHEHRSLRHGDSVIRILGLSPRNEN